MNFFFPVNCAFFYKKMLVKYFPESLATRDFHFRKEYKIEQFPLILFRFEGNSILKLNSFLYTNIWIFWIEQVWALTPFKGKKRSFYPVVLNTNFYLLICIQTGKDEDRVAREKRDGGKYAKLSHVGNVTSSVFIQSQDTIKWRKKLLHFKTFCSSLFHLAIQSLNFKTRELSVWGYFAREVSNLNWLEITVFFPYNL